MAHKQKPSRLAQRPPQATPPLCCQEGIMQGKRAALQAGIGGQKARGLPSYRTAVVCLSPIQKTAEGGGTLVLQKD